MCLFSSTTSLRDSEEAQKTKTEGTKGTTKDKRDMFLPEFNFFKPINRPISKTFGTKGTKKTKGTIKTKGIKDKRDKKDVGALLNGCPKG